MAVSVFWVEPDREGRKRSGKVHFPAFMVWLYKHTLTPTVLTANTFTTMDMFDSFVTEHRKALCLPFVTHLLDIYKTILSNFSCAISDPEMCVSR